MNEITLIIPYYRAPQMLRKQMEVARSYPPGLRVIVVDDGSPEPAVIPQMENVDLYRILEDIPWNREQARNLGAYVAGTPWIIQIDIDHILPPECAERLLQHDLNPKTWYRFPRFRIGRADDTRKKDALPPDAEYGQIKEHVDSYLVRRSAFLDSPYNEFFSGCLGGGGAFLARLERLYGPSSSLPLDVHLNVFTKDVIEDASITTLSRDTSEYKRRKREIGKDDRPKKMLLHPWTRIQ